MTVGTLFSEPAIDPVEIKHVNDGAVYNPETLRAVTKVSIRRQVQGLSCTIEQTYLQFHNLS
jgi:hypothetical protein